MTKEKEKRNVWNYCRSGWFRPFKAGPQRQPAHELLSAAKDADMIVVGSRGTGGFTRLLMGSVSTQVSHHAHGPVVIIPPEDRG